MRIVADPPRRVRSHALLAAGAALFVVGLVGCKSDASKEETDATAAAPEESAALSPSAEAVVEDAAAGVGDRARTMERSRVSRSRETVRSDAPKTKAVVGN